MKTDLKEAISTPGARVEFQVRFSPAMRAAAAPTPTRASVPRAEPIPQSAERRAPTPRLPRLTVLLVLGHHFERLVQGGAAPDYAEIARRTGLTRARVTQIVNLTLLAPEIQENILSGDDVVAERYLRQMAGMTDWSAQRDWEP